MFFTDALRSRLVSLLRPWLEEEPELELKLGLLRSSACAKDLSFDPSSLNPLIEESTRLMFKRVKVGELRLRISPWSCPSLIIEVQGVDVTLATRESGDEIRAIPRDVDAEKRKEVIASIDPEGSSLHEIIKRMSVRASSGNQLMTSLVDAMLRCCQIRLHDIHLQLQLLESHACLFEVSNFALEPQLLDRSSLFRGLMDSLLLSGKKSNLAISCTCVEFGLRGNDYVDRIISLRGLSACVRLNNLQPLLYRIKLQQVDFKISPTFIPFFMVMSDILSSKGLEGVRNGQQLWKIAIKKIRNLTVTSRLSLIKVVNIVVLWSRYVRAYQSLLLLVGYSADKKMKEHITRLSCDNKLLSCVKRQWSLVHELEENLPAEAVARARRIARCRALLDSCSTDTRSSTGLLTTLLKILSPVLFLWKVIHFIFQSLVRFYFVWSVWNVHQQISRSSKHFPPIASNDFGSQLHFTLNLEEICINFSPAIVDHHPIDGKVQRGANLHNLKLPFFGVIINCLCLISTVDESARSLFVACGELKLHLSFQSRVSTMESDLSVKTNPSSKGLKLEPDNESKLILWSGPALLYHPSERDDVDFTDHVNNASTFVLENSIGELWSNWKTICSEYGDLKVQHIEEPFILCELKSFLMNPYLSREDYGHWKCSFTQGKLTFDLDYSSILSTTLLFRQMQHYHHWITRIGKTCNLACSSSMFEEISEMKILNKMKLYTDRMKATMLNMVPDKNIQVGVLITGPTIRISLQSEQQLGAIEQYFNPPAQGNSKFYLVLDLENIEFVAWPVSKSIIAALTGESSFNEAAAEYLWLKEPQIVDVLNTHSNERFVSQGRVAINYFLRFKGMTAFVSDVELNQQFHVVELMSVTCKSSTCRDYLYSLSPTINVLSMAFSVITTGVTVLLHMDELWIFLRVFEAVFSGELPVFVNFESVCHGFSEDSIRKLMSSTVREIKNDMVESRATDGTMTTKSMQILIDATLQFESVDIILNSSRKGHGTRSSMKSYGADINSTPFISMSPTFRESNPGMLDMPSFGIGVFLQKSCVQISWDECHVGILIDLAGIQSAILNCQSGIGVCTDIFQTKNVLNQTYYYSYQLSISQCTLNFHVGSEANALSLASASSAINHFISGNGGTSYSVEGLSSNAEGSKPQSRGPGLKLKTGEWLTSSAPRSASGCWIVFEIGFGEILMAEYYMKDLIIGAHQPNRLNMSILVCEELETINCNIQGGLIFLETSALAMFVHCFKAYFLMITNCSSWMFNSSGESSRKAGNSMDSAETAAQRANRSTEYARCSGSPNSYSEVQMALKWNFLKALVVDLSQFYLVLAVSNESGGAQELIVEVDMSLKFMNFGRQLLFNLRHLTAVIQQLHRTSLHQTRDLLMPHFHSNTVGASSSYVNSGNCGLPGLDDLHSTCPPTSTSEILAGNSLPEFSPSCHASSILKHVTASIMMEKLVLGSQVRFVQLKSDWVGNGSVSGCDLTIRLSEIQMLLALSAPLTGISGVKPSHNVKQCIDSGNQGWTNNSDNPIPDGAIVAIQDLHQHMYFAVEAVDEKYCVVGALHYSLVGEKALFRVRYHKRWRSRVSWISLISLYAKNSEGIPLRLNCIPGSGFVEISSSDDKGWALWETFPCKPDSYEDDDVKSYDISSGKAFHLANQKNNRSIAFVDGLPEFVKKPGNPLKVKLFDKFSPRNNIGSLDVSYFGDACDTNVQESIHIEGDISGHDGNLPHVNITIDKVAVTILHEVSDANDKFPLLRGCINDISVTGQMLASKIRIITSFKAAIHYFDAQRNLWREIISPVDSVFFYRSRFTHPDAVNVNRGVPVHFYFRMTQVDIFLTEISLDVLLYLVGKLNIAGPYALRTSMIFPNCCKLENRMGMSLICHFADDQDVKIAGRQATSIFLRRAPLVVQHQENEGLASICVYEQGLFSTSPINISLSNAHVFAWRTRVVSLQDSRSFPGPFIVIELSKKTEEGLSLIVSPLLSIHNESGFSMELRFQRPQETEKDSVSILLRHGDTIDDSMAVFDSLDLSGGSKRAVMSLTLGNFLLSVKPQISEYIGKCGESISANWSEEDLKGGKAVRVSGIFDKLNYKFRKAFGVESIKSIFSPLHCSLIVEGQHSSYIYFLIQTISRDVPVMKPPNVGDTSDIKTSPVAIQMQKEIFIYPTVQVHNLLQSEICVLLSENHPDMCMSQDCNNIGKEAIIPCGSSAYLYANPSIIHFTITLTAYCSKCKPVNSGDWAKNLHKLKSEVHYLDIELDFGGKYFASLRLSRADRGILEVTVFTTYMLQNNTELYLFCCASNQKPLPWTEYVNYSSDLPPELGCFLPPNSTKSWFLKSNKVHLQWLEETKPKALLDLDILSGFTELCLEAQDDLGVIRIAKLGVSLQPIMHKICVPSQVVCIVPRYVICNESEKCITVRQCYLEDDMGGITSIGGKEKAALQVRYNTSKKGKTSLFDSIIRRHRNANEFSQIFIKFRPEESVNNSWSGPICVASLGRFFLKFKRTSAILSNQSYSTIQQAEKLTQFAVVHIVEESSSLVLHFYMPPDVALPYRIENFLRGLSIVYYQKESRESDMLGSGDSVEYVWDDLTLPHKLVVHVADMHLLREINMDKMCTWKPFFTMRQKKGLVLHSALDKRFGVGTGTDESHGPEVFKVGYEVYADGLTRVLRICELTDSHNEEKMLQPCANYRFRVSYFAMHLLENNEQNVDASELQICSTIVIARLTNITLDSLITEQYKHNRARVQSLNVDEKWQGAPFASMVRRSQLYDSGSNENFLHIIFILHSTNSNVKQVKYSSIVLQPIDLKVDEETLMRLVPFWRTSLSNSKTPSQQYYFKHFEIHPIKITASFLPGNPYSSYSSAQETLRSLLHSVIKVPTINNTVFELNGILLTHALLTLRDLLIKCGQHYSWYVIRAVYITKGSPLLPPAFASIFDDTASSSLDVFFDPSDGSINLPGVTLGMFKFISKCIASKGFSGTKRYFGDLGKTIKTASSNALFAAVTEISDSVLRGAETSGFNGMVSGFHQGVLRLAMEPSLLGAAVLEGGPDRKIKLDRSPGVDELYIEGYLQAMLDVMYKQEYLRVRVIDNQVVLKNLPPNSSVINDIVDNVKSFLLSKGLLKGDSSTAPRPLHHLRGEMEWKIGPTVLTLCEHLFVSFAIRALRRQSDKLTAGIRWKGRAEGGDEGKEASSEGSEEKPSRRWALGRFVLSGMVAYLDGRLCRHIPNPIARRIVSGFLLSFLDKKDSR